MLIVKGLDIADRFADWFVQWSGTFTREKFDDILDFETGGMLEVWADLLHITENEKYKHYSTDIIELVIRTLVGG